MHNDKVIKKVADALAAGSKVHLAQSKMLKKILIVCPYPYDTAPSQRLKYEQYLDYLKKNGYEFEISSFFNYKTFRILYLKGLIIIQEK